MQASWTSVHLLVKSRGIESRNNPHKQSINWLPVGVWPQIILWSMYLVLSLGFHAATTIIHYKKGTRELALLIFNSILPTASAAMAMPNLIKRLRAQTTQHTRLADIKHTTKANDNESVGSYMDTFQIRSPHEFDNTSMRSGVTQISGVSGHTKYAEGDIGSLRSTIRPRDKHAPNYGKSPMQPLNYDLRIIPSNTTTLVPNNNRLSCAQHIKGIAISTTRYSPASVATAVLSILIHILLCCGSVEEYQHGLAVSTLPEVISVPALYPDNIERTVSLSISCKGGFPIEERNWQHKMPHHSTILLEHVSGYPSIVSKSLQNALIMQNHRVCVYDRPGYMYSPQGYTPISPVTMEQALSSALREAGEEGPFYVVGHRSGAEYAQVFSNINRGSVVGMALVYPTDTALGGLLSPNQTASIRQAMAQAMVDNTMLPDSNLVLSRLNIQRILAPLGTWMTSPPTISDTSSSSQNITEWALTSPSLAQAQYLEMQQQPQLAHAISNMKLPPIGVNQLPVVLFGVNPDRDAQV
ncbi:hypothetical protein GGH15_003411, partial [Coemansia sp. RSA 562]